MYLNFFGSLVGRCSDVVVNERDEDTKCPGSTLGCDFLSFFNRNTLINGSKKF